MDTYDLKEGAGVYVLTLSGRFTYNHHSKVQDLVKFFTQNRAREVTLDLESLAFIDSSAVGMLLIIAQELKNIGGTLIIVNSRGQVDRVLRTASVYDVILTPQYTSVDKPLS